MGRKRAILGVCKLLILNACPVWELDEIAWRFGGGPYGQKMWVIYLKIGI